MKFLMCLLFLWCSFLKVYAQESDDSDLEVTFSNKGVNLAGTIHLPSGPGPFPGVVVVHGSGTSDRSNPWTSAYVTALLERGVAVLHPDKRGSGASGGNWREASFSDLADDAVAAFRELHSHPQVDSSRVGLIGFSQGGHIVPIAATRAPEVAYVINVSGSVVPILEQIGDELRLMGAREGLSEHQVKMVGDIHELAVQFVLTGQGWNPYLDALKAAKDGGLSDSDVIGGFPTERDSPAWGFLRRLGAFDPLPFWYEVDAPVLFMYGGRDQNVDVFKSTDIIQEKLTPADVTYSLLFFGNNGHALYREDAMDFVARWLHDGGID